MREPEICSPHLNCSVNCARARAPSLSPPCSLGRVSRFYSSDAKGNGCGTERQAVAPLAVVVAAAARRPVIVIVSLPFLSVLFAPRDNICLMPRRAPPRYAATGRT